MKKILFILSLIIGAIVFPLLLNLLISNFISDTLQDSWLNFMGGYLGALIAGILAYLAASYQINKQNESITNSEKRSDRSYIILEEFYGIYNLKDITHSSINSKIINTFAYAKVRGLLKSKNEEIPFYKINHLGGSDLIFDVNISLEASESNVKEIQDIGITILEKNTEIFIPQIYEENREIDVITITYKTKSGELMKYVYDNIQKVESHIVVKNNKECLLFESKFKPSDWYLPARNSEKKEVMVEIKTNNKKQPI